MLVAQPKWHKQTWWEVARDWIYFKVELTWFPERLDIRWEKKRRAKNDFKDLGLSRWKDGVTVNSDEQNRRRRNLGSESGKKIDYSFWPVCLRFLLNYLNYLNYFYFLLNRGWGYKFKVTDIWILSKARESNELFKGEENQGSLLQ